MKDWVIVTTWFASLTATTWSGATCLVLSYLKINSLSGGPLGPQANRPSAAPPYQPARCARANSKALESFTLYWIGFDGLPYIPFSKNLMSPTVFGKWAVKIIQLPSQWVTQLIGPRVNTWPEKVASQGWLSFSHAKWWRICLPMYETLETRDHWMGKIPWRRKWQPTPVFLPGKFHEQRSLAG